MRVLGHFHVNNSKNCNELVVLGVKLETGVKSALKRMRDRFGFNELLCEYYVVGILAPLH